MILRKTIKLPDYLNWDYHLFRTATHFFQEFGFYPNFALGKKETFRKIDTIANAFSPDQFMNKAHPEAEKQSNEEISEFDAGKFRLEFFCDESVEPMSLVLLYDSDPYSNEDVPVADT